MFWLYGFGDLRLRSSIEFPELQYGHGKHDFEVVTSPERIVFDKLASDSKRTSGLLTRFAALPTGGVFRFDGITDVVVDRCSNIVTCYLHDDNREDDLRRVLLNQVFPFLVDRPGRLVMHASGIVYSNNAIAFIGASGFGKSTLAAYLGERGGRLMSDDCLIVRFSESIPSAKGSYAAVSLTVESAMHFGFRPRPGLRKHTIFQEDPRFHAFQDWARLTRLFFIGSPATGMSTPVVGPIQPSDAMYELVQSTFRYDYNRQGQLQEEMQLASELLNAVAIRRLWIPHDFELLPTVVEAIEHDLDSDLDDAATPSETVR